MSDEPVRDGIVSDSNPLGLSRFNVSKHVTSDEGRTELINDGLLLGNGLHLTHTLNAALQSKGLLDASRGLTHPKLTGVSEPSYGVLYHVLKDLGLKLTVAPLTEEDMSEIQEAEKYGWGWAEEVQNQ